MTLYSSESSFNLQHCKEIVKRLASERPKFQLGLRTFIGDKTKRNLDRFEAREQFTFDDGVDLDSSSNKNNDCQPSVGGQTTFDICAEPCQKFDQNDTATFAEDDNENLSNIDEGDADDLSDVEDLD